MARTGAAEAERGKVLDRCAHNDVLIPLKHAHNLLAIAIAHVGSDIPVVESLETVSCLDSKLPDTLVTLDTVSRLDSNVPDTPVMYCSLEK